MKQTMQAQSEAEHSRAASAAAPYASQRDAFVDKRTSAAAQRKLAESIGGSARMTTQRRQAQAIAAQPVQCMTENAVPVQLADREAPQTNNTGLPDNLKSGIENLSGMSMDHVKVHYNSAQPAQLNAHAYAQGSDIHVAPGQEQHLPHEAWHVVQQAQGRVKPTLQMKEGVQVNDDAGLEHEADVMGGRAFEAGKDRVKARKREAGTNAGGLKTASFSMQRGAPAQPKLIVDGRTIDKKNLFDGSAFKKRLTKQMDVHAEQYDLIRNDVRNNIIDMIGSDQAHTFASTAELMAMASGNAHIDKEMEDHADGENWLVFGMDGKSKMQVQHAIRIGYRNFDCAQSYGTTAMLAQVIQDSGIERDEFTITYKFNLVNGELATALKARLTAVANLFNGYVNDLLIHNLDAGDAVIKAAWTVLQELKGEDVTISVGLGNLNEGHAHLVEELQEEGGIDVVENSLSSVLSSPDLMNMIKGTGADLMFYDVVRTAAEIGISSTDGIKAIMSAVENQMEGDTRKGEKRTHMIMSSSNLDRNIGNFKEFGDGADRENDWLNDGKNEKIVAIAKWQKEQTAVQDDDADFALHGGVKDALLTIAADNAAAMRISIATAAGGAANVTPQHVRTWLNAHTALSNQVQDSVKVPARPGLKKRYFNMTLGKVLEALFCPKNCDWKWSIQLVQLMIADVGLWDLYLKEASDQIVVN